MFTTGSKTLASCTGDRSHGEDVAMCWYLDFPRPRALALMSALSRARAEDWMRTLTPTQLQTLKSKNVPEVRVIAVGLGPLQVVFPSEASWELTTKRGIYVYRSGGEFEVVNYNVGDYADRLLDVFLEFAEKKR